MNLDKKKLSNREISKIVKKVEAPYEKVLEFTVPGKVDPKVPKVVHNMH